MVNDTKTIDMETKTQGNISPQTELHGSENPDHAHTGDCTLDAVPQREITEKSNAQDRCKSETCVQEYAQIMPGKASHAVGAEEDEPLRQTSPDQRVNEQTSFDQRIEDKVLLDQRIDEQASLDKGIDQVLFTQSSLDDKVPSTSASLDVEVPLMRTSLDRSVDGEDYPKQTSLDGDSFDEVISLRQTSPVDDELPSKQTSPVDDELPPKQTSLEEGVMSHESRDNDVQKEQSNEVGLMDRQPPSRHSQNDDVISLDSGLLREDVLSRDGDSLENCQPHTETPRPCCHEKTKEPTRSRDNLDQIQDTSTDRVLTREVRPQCGCEGKGKMKQLEARLKEQRKYDHTKLDCAEQQWQGGQATGSVSEPNGDDNAGDESLHDSGLAGEDELKAQNEALQAKAEILIQENTEKSMRITSLEGDLLEMTAKLKDTKENNLATMETCPVRQDRRKSKTCVIF